MGRDDMAEARFQEVDAGVDVVEKELGLHEVQAK
jgi:hypothetical protein